MNDAAAEKTQKHRSGIACLLGSFHRYPIDNEVVNETRRFDACPRGVTI
jgi:hypothetical protein